MWKMSFAAFSVLAVLVGAQNTAESQSNGLTAKQFRELADSLKNLPGRIEALRIFQPSGGGDNSVALATFDDQAGWQILVFRTTTAGKFQLEWKSGKLDVTFSSSSPNALKVFSFGEEQGIVFEGCVPHVCPNAFSIMLYVPSKRTSFTESYVQGKVTYSAGVESFSQYKTALDQLVSEHRDQ